MSPATSGSLRLSRSVALPLLMAAFTPVLGSAQQIDFGGQIRPRFESRDPVDPEGASQSFTSMRTRLSMSARLDDLVSAFIQVQDVRFFGEETSTLGDFDADALDIHQAWAEIGEADALLAVRAGRQEVSFGGERLVGVVDWTQQARSFDGVRLRIGETDARARVDVFGFQLAEVAADEERGDAGFLGAHGSFDAGEGRTVQPYFFWNADEGVNESEDTDQGTLGLRYLASAGPVEYRVEGAYQFGDRVERDVEAFFVGLRVGADVAGGDGTVTLWYDYLSGDDPTDPDDGVFNTLFATNHKFYGYADLFLDIPVDTDGRGLQDWALKTDWRPADGWRLGADLHHFRVAEDAGLAEARLGEELDLTASFTLENGARVTGGFSWLAEGDALTPVRGLREDLLWGYLMLDVGF